MGQEESELSSDRGLEGTLTNTSQNDQQGRLSPLPNSGEIINDQFHFPHYWLENKCLNFSVGVDTAGQHAGGLSMIRFECLTIFLNVAIKGILVLVHRHPVDLQ